MTAGLVRPANRDDIPMMLELSADKRREYEIHQSIFHRRAADAVAVQRSYFLKLIGRDDVVVRVAESDGDVVGFATAEIHTAPPVYDPGGPAAVVDDFTVRSSDLWPTIGGQLLDALTAELRSPRRGSPHSRLRPSRHAQAPGATERRPDHRIRVVRPAARLALSTAAPEPESR